MDDTYHIGEVADRTGLSLRTLRHWEEMGLVTPTGRSEGGFRLYGEEDIQRVLLARALKPAEFSLEELQEILRLRDHLATDLEQLERTRSEHALKGFLDRAELRCKLLRERLVGAELAMNALRSSLSAAPESPYVPLPTVEAEPGREVLTAADPLMSAASRGEGGRRAHPPR